MERYFLDPEDEIRVLSEGDGEAAIELFSGKRMMFFDISQVKHVCTVCDALVDKAVCECLRLICADSLLGREYEIFVPKNRADFDKFSKELEIFLPQFDFSTCEAFVKNSCDQTGAHHRHG